MEKTPHKCPVCGKYKFSEWNSYDICPECGWEDDSAQEKNPDDDLGVNMVSLNEYKSKYESGWRADWLNDLLNEEN